MKTAIEWLEEQMKTWGDLPRWMRDNIVEKSKTMEKDQIENAYRKGFNESSLGRFSDPENHYNETFKQQDDELRTKHD